MQKRFFKRAFLAGAVLALAACAKGPVDPDTGSVFNVAEVPEQKFVAGDWNDALSAPPKPINELTDNELRNVLRKLDGNLCRRNESLEECVAKFERPQADRRFRSLSGVAGRALVAAAASNKGGGNNKREVIVRGQILENCLHDPSLAGYSYDSTTRELRLCVFMSTEIKRPKQSQAGSKFVYQYFHVQATNARVEQKNSSNGNSVFPAAAAATGLNVSAAMAQNFDYKLYAAGRNIKVMNYWEAKAPNAQTNPNWKKYMRGQNGIPAPIRPYFEDDPDACVDMMFPASGVPSTLPPGAAGGVHYCLGRCKNPPIVNTR